MKTDGSALSSKTVVAVRSLLHRAYFRSHHDSLLFMHIVGHPENIVLVEGGVASLSPSELLRYSVDKDDVTGAGE